MSKLEEIITKEIQGKMLPSNFFSCRDFIGRILLICQSGASDFSFDKLSDRLGVARGVIHHIGAGRRPLSKKVAENISKALKLSIFEKKYLFALIDYEKGTTPHRRDEALAILLDLKEKRLSKQADKDLLDFFCEWYHPIIHQMIGNSNFDSDPEWIAKTIVPNLRPKQVEKSLDLLLRLGLIKIDHKAKKYVQVDKSITMPEGVSELGYLKYHKSMIDLAKDAVSSQPQESREINTMTICVSNDTVTKLKSEIHKLYLLALELEKEEGNEEKHVVQLNSQMFSLTKPFFKLG